MSPVQSIVRATVALTDGTLGTAADSLVEMTSVYVEASVANNQASLAGKVNEILVRLNRQGF